MTALGSPYTVHLIASPPAGSAAYQARCSQHGCVDAAEVTARVSTRHETGYSYSLYVHGYELHHASSQHQGSCLAAALHLKNVAAPPILRVKYSHEPDSIMRCCNQPV